MIKYDDLQRLCRGVCTALVIATFALPARSEIGILDWLAKDPENEGARRAVKESVKASSNRTERAKLAVAYCLACRYIGDWEEASRAQVFVDRDYEESPYAQYLDPSRTEDVCAHCLGVQGHGGKGVRRIRWRWVHAVRGLPWIWRVQGLRRNRKDAIGLQDVPGKGDHRLEDQDVHLPAGIGL